MGKICNAILMLEYLKSGHKYTTTELSKKIGISERMIKYYKNEIELCGIRIESFKGPDGGYFLLNNSYSYYSINKYDIQLLQKIEAIVCNDDKKYFNEFINKIIKIYNINEEKAKYENIDEDYIPESIKMFEMLIKNKQKISILYKGIDGKYTTRIIHPVQLFNYDNEYYITAFCELRNDIRHFEIKNIILK